MPAHAQAAAHRIHVNSSGAAHLQDLCCCQLAVPEARCSNDQLGIRTYMDTQITGLPAIHGCRPDWHFVHSDRLVLFKIVD